MRVSLKWLAEYVDISMPVEELAHRLTMAGVEVSTIESTGGDWDGVSVGEVERVDPHPNADRLRLATVVLGGGESMTVVCGAPNVAAGQKIAFARTGARLIDGHTGELTVLKPAKIRGVESAGMVCSEKELGLSDYHEGILVLADDAPVGAPLAQHLGDTVLDFDITPNRPDCLSVLGIAREVAALSVGKVREPPHTYAEHGPPIRERVSVEIADPDLCSRYCASLIEGVEIGPSPAWMQERLLAAGMRPINNIVDVTNYVMMEMGQPLHAFDMRYIGGRKIIVRRPEPDEKLTTLDDVRRVLTPDMLVIADAHDAVALAGVMGGANSEVSDATTDVLLESANFNPISIRRTSTTLKMRSEASTRFEKGLSPDLSAPAARRATRLMLELAGGTAARGLADAYPRKAKETRVNLNRRRLHQVLGIDPPTSKVRSVLTSLGFACRWVPPQSRYEVRVPYWRTDVRIADDVAEEVARIIGYDEIPTSPLAGAIPTAPPQPPRELRERVRSILASAGMQEVITYSLTNMETLRRVLSAEALKANPPIRIANPMSSEQEHLRTTLRASLLEALAANVSQAEGTLALFETARVYLPRRDDLPSEPEHLVGVVCGRRTDRWGHATDESVDLYDAKGYLEFLFERLGLAPAYVNADEHAMLRGRTAELSLDGRRIGVLGQVDPRVAATFDIESEVFLFEVMLDELLEGLERPRRYEAVSRFPPVVQDIAVVVDEGTAASDVKALIEAAPLVREARLFDVYTGEPIAAGQKSLAFSVTYQSPDHTLTDQEVSRSQRGIVERLKRQLGATLRS
jgi:phenylalanyl-tRNA synthetase beta chain